MSKASKTKQRIKRREEKRRRKAAMKAQYQRWAEMGENNKTIKKAPRKLKDYNQGDKRPRVWNPGHKPNSVSLSAQHKTTEYGEWLKWSAEQKRSRRFARAALQAA